MKNQITKKRRSLIWAIIAMLILLTASGSIYAQDGIGKKYGTRDPRPCLDNSQPKGNIITADKAAEYVYCNESYTRQNMYLYDEVIVKQVGKPRRYNPNEDINVPNIDVTIPVTPIRGSLKSYQCGVLDIAIEDTRGRNCNVTSEPNADGLCYKDSFGNWHCSMVDTQTSQLLARGASPPGGVPGMNKPDMPKAKTPPKADVQHTENKPLRNENGYPTPDMSAMEKWYDITKVEYGDLATDPNVHFLFKPKVAHNSRSSLNFMAQYLDKDGVLIGSYQVGTDFFTDPGQIGKGGFGTPSEKEMQKVASVKIVRLIQ